VSKTKLRRLSTVGWPQDLFEALSLVAKLLRLQDLKETEHFRHWRQEKVAKIVQCGEQLSSSKDKATWKRWLQFFRNRVSGSGGLFLC
jgi:hypothetical protein